MITPMSLEGSLKDYLEEDEKESEKFQESNCPDLKGGPLVIETDLTGKHTYVYLNGRLIRNLCSMKLKISIEDPSGELGWEQIEYPSGELEWEQYTFIKGRCAEPIKVEKRTNNLKDFERLLKDS